MWTRGRLTELHQAHENVISLHQAREKRQEMRREDQQERTARARLYPLRRVDVSPAVPCDPKDAA
jgi:hypothetical protein